MDVSFNVDGVFVTAEISSFSRSRAAQVWGPPENCYPAEPAEVSIAHVWVELPTKDGGTATVDIAAEAAFESFMDKVYAKALEEIDGPDNDPYEEDYE